MAKKAQLIITDTYFNVFNVLAKTLDGKTKDLSSKNLVFCEEKVSLMAERRICERTGGSFNTDVYSFGKFLRRKKNLQGVLSKEGSAMAVKRIITDLPLECLKKSKKNLAPSVFELIVQLKSANVTPDDLLFGAESAERILGAKLKDIALIYSEYEKYIYENGFGDQSSILSMLPEIIENDPEMPNTDVFLLGYQSFTAQAKDIVRALLKTAKSVTAIFTDGDNKFLYLGETAFAFKRLCDECKITVEESFEKSDVTEEGKIILNGMFNPYKRAARPIQTEKITLTAARTVREEIETVAETIKAAVMGKGERYGAFSVAVPDVSAYKNRIRAVFSKLKIPYFLDEKKKPDANPLITLIGSYCDVWRKNFDGAALASFFKNPLFCADKDFTDSFGLYLKKFGIKYTAIKKPFTLGFSSEEERILYEDFRKRICSFFDKFDVDDMLYRLGVEEKLKESSVELDRLGEREEAESNRQVYNAVKKILDEMKLLLGGVDISVTEWKNIFTSGITALELSIIPQYSDAVFIGGYKEIALAKGKYLFAIGLTSDVPTYKEDVSLLSDEEIDKLDSFKILVEPKIKIVNDRSRENTGVALASFSERLFVAYPVTGDGGDRNVESEIIKYLKTFFIVKDFAYKNEYLTEEQGLMAFAKTCGDYSNRKTHDFSIGAAYYNASKSGIAEEVVKYANKEVKVQLSSERKTKLSSVISPTVIESYYKCPYKVFVERTLKAETEDSGESVDSLSVGNILHEILEKFVGVLKDEKIVLDKTSSDALVTGIAQKIIDDNEDYKRYTLGSETEATLKNVIEEAKSICYKVYLSFEKSDFKPFELEKKILVPIKKGKYSIKGKVDRVDAYGDYIRIVDYKSGSKDSSEKALFSGTKLQLYLYASAFKDKKLAGAYYLGINGDYADSGKKSEPMFDGKTLDDEEVVYAQDKSIGDPDAEHIIPISGRTKKPVVYSAETLANFMNYAVKASEKAAERIEEGFIMSSPYENTCDYCPFSAFCDGEFQKKRTLKKVDDETFDGIDYSED